jgi:hypothetical protein
MKKLTLAATLLAATMLTHTALADGTVKVGVLQSLSKSRMG